MAAAMKYSSLLSMLSPFVESRLLGEQAPKHLNPLSEWAQVRPMNPTGQGGLSLNGGHLAGQASGLKWRS